MGTERSTGPRAVLAVRPRDAAGPVRGAARHHAARAARDGRRHPRGPRAEVLDARRLVDADLHGRAPRRPARLRVGRRGGLDARHARAADLRRDHLGGARGDAVDRVLQARVVRQVHAVPRGHVLADAGAAADRGRAGHARGHRPAARPVRQHPGPRVLRARRRCDAARSRRPCSTSATEFEAGTHTPADVLVPARAQRAVRLHAAPDTASSRGCTHDDPVLRADDLAWSPPRRSRPRSPTGEPVTFTVDGIETAVPKGTLVIRAAEQLGIQIPRFCDHPLLAPGRRVPPVPGRGLGARSRRQPGQDAEAAGQLHARGHARACRSRRSTRRPRPTRRSTASWSCCSSTTRSTARSATRAASARCRTRR